MSQSLQTQTRALYLQTAPHRPVMVGGVLEGVDGAVLGELAHTVFADKDSPAWGVLHIARDDKRLEAVADAVKFFAPDVKLISLPAWDCVPYDRVSPNAEISSKRIAGLARMLSAPKWKAPVVVLSTINAALQRVPTREFMRKSVLSLRPGQVVEMEDIRAGLEASGYRRVGTVMEAGEYAIRGGIIDLFPPGRARPVRLDFFGDELESIRSFNPESQRTAKMLNRLVLLPVSEARFGADVAPKFRQRYMELFGAVTSEDPLYEAVSHGARYEGMEHWLPLFHERLETLFDYINAGPITFDHLVEDARTRRLEQVEDHYQARESAQEQKTFGAAPYRPVPTDLMFLSEQDWRERVGPRPLAFFSPYEMPETEAGMPVVSMGGRQGRNFAAERARDAGNVFEAAVGHLRDLKHRNKLTLVACWSNGARERLRHLLQEHGLEHSINAETWPEARDHGTHGVGFVVLGLESGFDTPDLAIVGEQDILGDRLIRPRRTPKKGADVLSEVSTLSVGDLVVHADHGIGRFTGLRTIEAMGAPHDCLELVYHGGDKLYLPVENIELLTRYGSDEAGAVLDRLGGQAWQARKARLKQRIRDIAEKLIKVAALRELRRAPALQPNMGDYEEFAARFPFEETDDQASSIEAVIEDLGAGRPMDRLVCGDVGFGKTEVALRSAFIAVMAGKQVAVVVPTTLLARQHFHTFKERFKGYPVHIAQASRLVAAKALSNVKQGLKTGSIDIVIGTHALLGKSISFADLGMLVIDEEQHFGVQHKERIKQMREDVHVLTLTATPIPRTLQLSLSGVRDLSIIATPPLDRLAVRTFVTPFDPVILREALLRERYRGGQSFYVCPRVSDLDEAEEFLREHVPELKVARAHGQMPTGRLEDVMNAFYDREYDVLLSTTIVESGLDIPTANTLVVHRADMFGLAQLYQLRGRVGRSKARAYAYFTIPARKKLTDAAQKRLKVLQSLDTLGAGFALASHDLDIRGAGNLLGEEQSGHIKEVGFELYQSMLEETVAALRGGDSAELEDQWSPQISIGTSVLIPENYVADLQVRLGLYRRLSTVTETQEIEAFAAELEDRFGPVPDEVHHLFDIVRIKALCRQAGIEKIDAGPKGGVITFRNNSFANPGGLVEFMATRPKAVKLQPDHKLVYRADWADADQRLRGTRELVRTLSEIAANTDDLVASAQ